MATLAKIRSNAAEMLQLKGEGVAMPSYVSDDMTEAYTEVYAELQGLDLTAWGSTDAVPDKYSWSVSTLMAARRVSTYPVPGELYQRIKLDEQSAMSRIRELQAPAKMGTTEIENF